MAFALGVRLLPTQDADIALRGPAGVLLIEVKAGSVLDADRARAQVEAYQRELAGRGSPPPDMVVLVADIGTLPDCPLCPPWHCSPVPLPS